jgi:pimeloyl-ACP methyl ester carboxylesterase
MAAGKPNPAFGAVAGEYQRYWVEQSRLLARKSAKSRFVLAETASHALHLDAPDLVVESILAVVRESRLRP